MIRVFFVVSIMPVVSSFLVIVNKVVIFNGNGGIANLSTWDVYVVVKHFAIFIHIFFNGLGYLIRI